MIASEALDLRPDHGSLLDSIHPLRPLLAFSFADPFCDLLGAAGILCPGPTRTWP